ncbi:MAG: HigA family addiction module antidote protein [Acidobacteriota bacterium]|nr:MAG: HigA family addiction module antidote protein [Acidobacteriota bacterium]
MAEELLPPIHPGEILLEEYMKPLGLSANALSNRLGVTAARVNEIVNGKRGITADTALRLARFFRTTPEFWLNLQKNYELEVAKREVGARILEEISPLAA